MTSELTGVAKGRGGRANRERAYCADRTPLNGRTRLALTDQLSRRIIAAGLRWPEVGHRASARRSRPSSAAGTVQADWVVGRERQDDLGLEPRREGSATAIGHRKTLSEGPVLSAILSNI
ncbi:hypothetical protein Sinac_3750 [Singulisphaera acidiphila DSM 18658]|uniref:Uncharacterized protein n=1 Tax=Singulisphaera acidiphila (strain ATCC BAA-1392 / DSM 18658 / VKM B-2454 / MOB10) TaxID=886293 RepID=L0DGQ5_SINAD|nr:hypothetical protein Sinac_3750 [Singulisphaera acidiphila DSM 18658]